MANKLENGSQTIVAISSEETYVGGNAPDSIDILGNGNSLYGGNGADSLIAVGLENLLDGGNGDDSLSAAGAGNGLYGGNGDDTLSALGISNFLDGGNGADSFFSLSAGTFFYPVGLGNVITGGSGLDNFSLRNTSNLYVDNDSGADTDVLDQGDHMVGLMDVIVDYAAGEQINIGGVSMAALPVGLDASGSNRQHLELGDGEYAFVRGSLLEPGSFIVDEEGSDTLVVYDTANGTDALTFQGAVVLIGVTDTSTIVIT